MSLSGREQAGRQAIRNGQWGDELNPGGFRNSNGFWRMIRVIAVDPCQSYIVLSESETGQLVVWFRYLAVEWCFSTFQHPPTDFLENTLIFALVIDLRSKLMKII